MQCNKNATKFAIYVFTDEIYIFYNKIQYEAECNIRVQWTEYFKSTSAAMTLTDIYFSPQSSWNHLRQKPHHLVITHLLHAYKQLVHPILTIKIHKLLW